MKLLKIILFVFLSTIVYSQELDYRFMTNKIVFKKGKKEAIQIIQKKKY